MSADDDGYFGADVAARYDADEAEMFDAAVLDETVSCLAALAALAALAGRPDASGLSTSCSTRSAT